MLLKEYRIAMPLTVEEYHIGQLFMIAKHSHEQSEAGEGVEVVENVPIEDEEHGKGQFTEKRIHISSRLPTWAQSFIPRIFYVTEKAWNYYPYTITEFQPLFFSYIYLHFFFMWSSVLSEYTCSFLPKFKITIHTRYEDNSGTTENCLNLPQDQLDVRIVDHVDIAYDEVAPKHYKEEEDVRFFSSSKTGRGPLPEGWRDATVPVMCSYKVVDVRFEVWGLQTKVEDLVHRTVREILVLGHRQAFAWIDEWYGMTVDDVRMYEGKMQQETNTKVLEGQAEKPLEDDIDKTKPSTPVLNTPPITPNSVANKAKSWFSWS